MLRRRRLIQLWASVLLFGCTSVGKVHGQDSGAAAAANAPRTVSGEVLDALHGTPIARALVRLNARAVLTDARGHFEFPEFTDVQAFASVTKPGYAASAESTDGPAMLRIADLNAAVNLRLYPDAVVTGTITGQNGLALPGVGVQLLRANYDPAGLAAVPVRFTSTDARGGYRFREPAGRYRVSVRFAAALAETNECVLPDASPSESPRSSPGYFEAKSGEEIHVDLHPVTGALHPVDLIVEGMPARDGLSGNLRVTVFTKSGERFDVQAVAAAESGQYKLELPVGSFELHAVTGLRDDRLEGFTHVLVTARERTRTSMQLASPVRIPIETDFQQTAQTRPDQQPKVEQLNLRLQNASAQSDLTESVQPETDRDGQSFFRVGSGRYRLTSSGSGAWHVQAASFGASDLFTDEIVIGGGSVSGPIRLRASNASGHVYGTVQMPAGETGWLYLVPQSPGLASYIIQRLNVTGSFNTAVPPGTYLVVALGVRVQEDLRDSKLVSKLASLGRVVDVTLGGNAEANVTLTRYPAGAR